MLRIPVLNIPAVPWQKLWCTSLTANYTLWQTRQWRHKQEVHHTSAMPSPSYDHSSSVDRQPGTVLSEQTTLSLMGFAFAIKPCSNQELFPWEEDAQNIHCRFFGENLGVIWVQGKMENCCKLFGKQQLRGLCDFSEQKWMYAHTSMRTQTPHYYHARHANLTPWVST